MKNLNRNAKNKKKLITEYVEKKQFVKLNKQNYFVENIIKSHMLKMLEITF